MKISQTTIGIILFITVVVVAFFLLDNSTLFLRFLIGFGFGFALVKASLGFAGSVNRLARAGTSQTAKALMMMFLFTAILSAFVLNGDESSYKLNIYPINVGLLLGGLLFGFGMALSSCCATGSLTDLSSAFSKAMVTIFFLSMGVFLGFSTQVTASWVKESWVSSPMGESSKGGVFLPDLFTFDGFNGYLGAIVLTSLFALSVALLAHWYEKKLAIAVKEKPATRKKLTLKSMLSQPWSLKVSIFIIALLFVTLLLLSHKGWSATSPFGVWFAKLLMLFGISAESISDFTHRPVSFFTQPLASYATSLQNFGIVFGSFVALLLSNEFTQKFFSSLRITPKAFVIYAMGGLMMGFGTRLSNGCNVGALYTPIAEFSLSGWVYLVVVAIGGFTGNWFIKKYISPSCSF